MRRRARSALTLSGAASATLTLTSILASRTADAANASYAWVTEAGAYLSYDFGGDSPGHFGFGLELREMHEPRTFECGQGGAGYGGGAARLSASGLDQARLLVAPQFGWSTPAFPDLASIGAELAVGYRFGREPGAFVQPGIEGSVANLFFLRLDRAVFRDVERRYTTAAVVDLGARFSGISGVGCGVE